MTTDKRIANLSKTAAALKRFDAEEARLNEQITQAQDQNVIAALVRREGKLAREVAHAYWEDTQAFNSKETCLLLHPGPSKVAPGAAPSFLRRMVAKWYEQERAEGRCEHGCTAENCNRPCECPCEGCFP